MAEGAFRVLIAGGGVAGLEALLAVHELAGDQVDLMLVAPEDDFVYRPLAVQKPYSVGRVHRVPLSEAAKGAGAGFAGTTVQEVDLAGNGVTTSDGTRLEYDALVLAVGAEPHPVISRALTWDDRADAELIGGFVRDFEEGYSRRLAVIVPSGPSWPLRGYELALSITLDVKRMGLEIDTSLVQPERSPLDALGGAGQHQLMDELAAAGVSVFFADQVDVEVEDGQQRTLVLSPSGERIEADRVVALPTLRGRTVKGVPTDENGFIDVDEHCRVRAVDGVWAVGDGTTFPVKSGGIAAEQADAAAEDIAALAGADVAAHPFDPADRRELLGLPAAPYLRGWLTAREGEDVSTAVAPEARLPVLTYLERDFEAGQRGS
jgi:sulfide:quinone oxidoreductase